MNTPEEEYLSAGQIALLPDQEAIRFYREHGWWVSPVCIESDLLDDACYGTERYYAGERDWPLMVNVGIGWTPAEQARIRTSDYLSLQMEEFRRLVQHPIVPAMAARLAGTSEIRLFHDQLLYKSPSDPASTTAIGWHTDKSYWRSCTSVNMLTAWVPLQDCTADMGPLAVFDGSHQWSHGDDLQNFGSRELGPIEERLRAAHGDAEPVVIELRRGQVSFHHCRTIHGSRPNVSSNVRIACAIHYQDADNRFNATRLPDGRTPTHINDMLCRRGADQWPDYADPDVCLRLWPPTAAVDAASSPVARANPSLPRAVNR
ncbi:phytanoyl-CoA dioxygenase family protein [Dyella tabacisoli]|nr:phytanoyl-CoA dioxygenase family protein [Dyella tabacisoli]